MRIGTLENLTPLLDKQKGGIFYIEMAGIICHIVNKYVALWKVWTSKIAGAHHDSRALPVLVAYFLRY